MEQSITQTMMTTVWVSKVIYNCILNEIKVSNITHGFIKIVVLILFVIVTSQNQAESIPVWEWHFHFKTYKMWSKSIKTVTGNAKRLVSSLVTSHIFLTVVKTTLPKQNLFSFFFPMFLFDILHKCHSQSGSLSTIVNEPNPVLIWISPYIHDNLYIFICNNNIRIWTCACTLLTLQMAIYMKNTSNSKFSLFQVSESHHKDRSLNFFW